MTMPRLPRLPRHVRGFTLVEAILVIVITGIIGGIVAVFIKMPVQNYVDSAGRAELSDLADTAVRRMAREIRLAVPNSIRLIGTDTIEFIPTKTGGRYLAAEDGVGGQFLNFSSTTDTDFYVVGPMATGTQAIAINDYIVVFNLGSGFGAADAYVGGNRAQVVSVNPATKLVGLASNPFAAQVPVLPHPLHRFLVTSAPVTFRCSSGSLLRHADYGFQATQPALPAGTPALLAGNIKSCKFDYIQIQNTRSALVGLTLELERAGSSDGPLRLTQQIHVDKTP